MLLAFVITQISNYKQNNRVATKLTKSIKKDKPFLSKKGNAEGYDYMGDHIKNIIIAAIIMPFIFYFSK